MRRPRLRHGEVRLGLGRMDQIRKLHRVLDEEDRDVVADEIPIPFVRVELHREPTHVPGGVGRTSFAEDGRKADEDRCLFPNFTKERRAGELGDSLGTFEDAVRRGAARMHNPLGDAFVVEVSDLLPKDEVLEQRRTAEACLQRALILRNGHALIGCERAVRRIDADAVERARRGILANGRPATPNLVGCVHLADRTRPDNRINGLDRCPLGRRECRLGIVFGCLVRIEGECGGHVLRTRGLIGDDVACA